MCIKLKHPEINVVGMVSKTDEYISRCRCTPDFRSVVQYVVCPLLRCQLENDGMTTVPVHSKRGTHFHTELLSLLLLLLFSSYQRHFLRR